jgi:membrane protein implicated in regulation of membrane protease activity
MIFEGIIVLVLLTVIVGLVYQFMYDIFLWVTIGSIIFYLLFVVVELFVYLRRRKKLKINSSEPTKEKEEVKKEKKVEKVEEVSEEDTSKEKVSEKSEDKKSEEKTESSEEDGDVFKLKGFIQKNLDKGFKEKIIRDALLKQGWPQKQIDKAFNS